MSEERKYLRTSTRETADGLIKNFETNTMPGNRAVREHFGILGDDDERLYDAMKWAWENGHLSRDRLVELHNNGPALTLAVNVEGNPYSPVEYRTMGDLVREMVAEKRAEAENLA